MTESALALARAGDDEAFRELVDPYRPELQLHCYRILGSVQDAEDMVQETLLAAWRGLDRFEGRSSLRAWLYRIATNRCLNALRDQGRRPRRLMPDPPFDPPQPTRGGEAVWVEPYPDSLLDDLVDAVPGPDARYEAREAIELAFIVALQRLPPRQRAALILRDVLGYHADEVAEMLDATNASVKSALQRARATLGSRLHAPDRDHYPRPRSERERALARKFGDAFENDDIEALIALLTDDAWLTMPPYPHAYQGRAAIAGFLHASANWRGASRYPTGPHACKHAASFRLLPPGSRAACGSSGWAAGAHPRGRPTLERHSIHGHARLPIVWVTPDSPDHGTDCGPRRMRWRPWPTVFASGGPAAAVLNAPAGYAEWLSVGAHVLGPANRRTTRPRSLPPNRGLGASAIRW